MICMKSKCDVYELIDSNFMATKFNLFKTSIFESLDGIKEEKYSSLQDWILVPNKMNYIKRGEFLY